MRSPASVALGLSIFLTAGLLVLCATARAEYRPHRYLDGEALANYMTRWVLRHERATGTIVSGRPTDSRLGPRMLWTLWAGDAFGDRARESVAKLEQWVMSRPDDSISPDQLLTKAIALEGNVQRGLVLAWDYLGDGWSNSDTRNHLPRNRKLIDITGEFTRFEGNDVDDGPKSEDPLEAIYERQTIRGDKFSAWYHFVGTALLSYAISSSRLGIDGKSLTRAMIFIEENILHRNEFIDPEKRLLIDRQGAVFGSALAANLKKFDTEEAFASSAGSSRTKYLYDDPSKFSADWALLPNERPRDYELRKVRPTGCAAFRQLVADTLFGLPLQKPR